MPNTCLAPAPAVPAAAAALLVEVVALAPDATMACAEPLTRLLEADPGAWSDLTGLLACGTTPAHARDEIAATTTAVAELDAACEALAADATRLAAGPHVVVAVDAARAVVDPARAAAAFEGTVDGPRAVLVVPAVLYGHDAQVLGPADGADLQRRCELAAALWSEGGDGVYADPAAAWEAAGALLDA